MHVLQFVKHWNKLTLLAYIPKTNVLNRNIITKIIMMTIVLRAV